MQRLTPCWSGLCTHGASEVRAVSGTQCFFFDARPTQPLRRHQLPSQCCESPITSESASRFSRVVSSERRQVGYHVSCSWKFCGPTSQHASLPRDHHSLHMHLSALRMLLDAHVIHAGATHWHLLPAQCNLTPGLPVWRHLLRANMISAALCHMVGLTRKVQIRRRVVEIVEQSV